MLPLRLVLISTFLVIFPGVTAAQRLPAEHFRSYEPSVGTAPSPAAAALVPPADDYRYEGLVVGAIVVGTSAGILLHVGCGFDDRLNKDCTLLTIEGGLAGAALGGLTGALIGGMIPKGPEAGPP